MRQLSRILTATLVALLLAGGAFAQMVTQPRSTQNQVQNAAGQQNLITSDWLIGKTVYSPKAEELGSITNLIVNEKTGQIGYAVISTGGFFDLSDVKQIVPYRALNINPSQAANQVSLNMDKAKLAQAPQWKQGLTVDEFNRQAEQFFGVSPVWGDSDLINQGVFENNRGKGLLENDRGGIIQDRER